MSGTTKKTPKRHGKSKKVKDIEWSKKERRAMLAWLAEVQEHLRLTAWTIAVDFDTPGDPDAWAEVTIPYGQQQANIQLGPLFKTLDEDGRTQTLVHELLHIHLNSLQTAGNLTAQCVPEPGNTLAEELIHWQVESCVDALADVLAPFLPPLRLP